MKFKRQHDPKYKGSTQKEDYSDIPSMTVPDQSLSLKKLLKDHTRLNAVIATHQKGYFTEDEIAPNYEDRLEFIEAGRDLDKQLNELQNEIDNDIQRKKEQDQPGPPGSDKESASKELFKEPAESEASKGGGEA